MNPIKYIKSIFDNKETEINKLSVVFGNVSKTENNTYYCYNLDTEFTLTESEIQSIIKGDYKNCLEVVKPKLGDAYPVETVVS